MKNKYLTKISGIVSGIASNVIRPAFDIGKDVLKDVGTSIHKATGGGFRDAAVAKGITNQHTLRQIHDPKSYLRAVRPKNKPLASRIAEEPSPASAKSARKAEIKGLQRERKKSIMKSVGYGGAAMYGSNKILDKIKERNELQYYQ